MGKQVAYSQCDRGFTAYSVKTDRYRYTEWRNPKKLGELGYVELFDHLKDPDETQSIASSPEWASVIREHRQLMSAGFKRLREANIDFSRRDTLRFVYTGAIYGGKRDLRPFFEAISYIITSSKPNKNIIQLEYAGKEGRLFLSQASEYNLSDYVVDHGQLSRLDSLKLQKESDICLLATWNTSYEQGALTGKIFE